MENINLYCKIYELKGMIGSLIDMSEEDDRYCFSIVERMDTKIKEIVQEIETKGA